MAVEKKEKNQSARKEESKAETFWRKPITLDVTNDQQDPLATLYQGRETSNQVINIDSPTLKTDGGATDSAAKKSKSPEKLGATKKDVNRKGKKTPDAAKTEFVEDVEQSNAANNRKISESELKDILKIKSETFHFTDIREILRGKSIEIYAHLRLLCGDEGICKIKHLDLMKQLDISRPTLFKQSEWLTRLLLIEKRNVPGDHLGTSYIVRRLEDVLPISDALVKQLESYIENLV